jgi:acetyl-CoA carboxylase biotin carboxyl carrier protein
MKKSDLSEFEIQDQDFKLRIKRDLPGRAPIAALAAPVAAAPVAAAPAPVAAAPAPAAPAAADPSIKLVTSPMVGTYYATPSPENPPFVTVGSPIKADSVVCIIEAMKVMNEIQSEISGTVVECLVANGTSVEFGQPLFRVKVS